ncbi:MAG: YeeE/YedE thiosulfate transporter family protein [Vicingaceae bacterium]|nr:YeeE/YedE thiosulfate transporter family protein [Vicingaceae bacterium]
MKQLFYIISGIYFGFILIKSEAVSWFRILEMFHFQSFHMFGVIISAILTGIISVLIIKKKFPKIDLTPKPLLLKANFFGGILFGVGWSIVGACTAPLFIHLGSGNFIILIPLLFALLGTYLYGILKNKLPH